MCVSSKNDARDENSGEQVSLSKFLSFNATVQARIIQLRSCNKVHKLFCLVDLVGLMMTDE